MSRRYEINGEEVYAEDVLDDGTEYTGLIRENWYRDVWLIVITAFVAWALLNFESNQNDLEKVAASNEALTNQMCGVLVNVHDASITRVETAQRALTGAKNYIHNIPPGKEGTQLNKAIIRNLSQTEADLKAAKQSEVATRVPPECVKRKVTKEKDQ